MHIAVEGCSHGELDIIYNTIERLESIHKLKIDLLLCCGDFQAVRNEGDLKCMAVPVKYMQMQDFHKYYSGEKKAPVLTIFIGGNHEASNYLQELPYGGWVAPNIYYLGYAGVVRFGDLRIGGLSGIYKGSDYLKGHYEKTPYSSSTLRSVYHVRNLEVFRLKQLSGNLDIFMSHDWPRGIYHHGNVTKLLQFKRHFASEVKNNTLGSRPAEDILKKLMPDYWFSGHLHVKFSAIMKHEATDTSKRRVTKFLALDKCLPKRQFLQVLQLPLPSPETPELSHDAEWLTVLRLTNHLLSTNANAVYMPGPGSAERYEFTPTPEEIQETIDNMGGSLKIPESNFVRTAECFSSNMDRLPDMNFVTMPDPLANSQTLKLCSKLGIDDPLGRISCQSPSVSPPFQGGGGGRGTQSSRFGPGKRSQSGPWNKSEMNITDKSSSADSFNVTSNPEEVELSDGDEIEFSKDEETGDIIMELPVFSSSSQESPSCIQNISPIRGDKVVPPSRDIFSSPFSSSPRVNPEGVKSEKQKMCLSKPKEMCCRETSPLAARESSTPSPRPSQGGESTSSEASPPSFTSAFAPLSLSSQSEEESDSTGRSASQKRESSCDDESDVFPPGCLSTPDETPTPATPGRKKLKRRNDSIYKSNDDA